MKTAIEALGRGYVDAGADRLLVIPGPTDATTRTDLGDVVQLRAPRVGGGYRLIVEPWRVIDVLEELPPDLGRAQRQADPAARRALGPTQRRGLGAVLPRAPRRHARAAHRPGDRRQGVHRPAQPAAGPQLRPGRRHLGVRPGGVPDRRGRRRAARWCGCRWASTWTRSVPRPPRRRARRRHDPADARRPALPREVAAAGRRHGRRAAPPRTSR